MMSDITEEEWNRIREHFGDLAYECPEMHRQMLEILDMQNPDAALETATKELRADFAEGLSVRLGLAEFDRGDSVAVEETIAKAKANLEWGECLAACSAGRLSRRQAIFALGMRDSADLLVALGDAGLPMPQPSKDEVREQAATFARLFRENKEAKVARALKILDRAPDGPVEPWDKIAE